MSSSIAALQAPQPTWPAVELALILEARPGSDAATSEPTTLLDPSQAEAIWAERLALWLAELQTELPPARRAAAYSLSLSLVDDARIARLNQDWRHVEGPTDVLAFAALEEAPPQPGAAESGSEEPLELGDIVISLQTAQRQALQADHDLSRELQFLASHGLLHLLGWDHPDEASLEAMLALQERLIQRTGG